MQKFGEFCNTIGKFRRKCNWIRSVRTWEIHRVASIIGPISPVKQGNCREIFEIILCVRKSKSGIARKYGRKIDEKSCSETRKFMKFEIA